MATPSQKNDKRKLYDAHQVNDRTRLWTVVVQVVVKYQTKQSQSDPNSFYKKFVLTDMKGTRISAITFSAIDHFDRILQPFNRYYVTNAGVKDANPKYKIGDYNYTWTLYPKTHVQLLHDPVPHVLPCAFNFTKFSEMFKVADRDVSIDVKALVVHSYPIPHATKPFIRDYILIDEEKRPMILRLWDDLMNETESEISIKLPQPTLLVGLDLKVTTHNGLSLTNGFNAYFMINPPLHEKDPLLVWYNEHTEEIGQLIKKESYKSTDVLLPPPPATEIVPIKDVLRSMETLKTAWIAATVHMMPAQDKIWYTVCDKCKKTVNLPVGWAIPCMYCNKEMDVQPRLHLNVYFNDGSGTLPATLFSPVAEHLINFTATDLMEADEKNAPLDDEIAKRINKKSVLCFLKCFDKSFKGKAEKTYPVVKLYTEEQLHHATTQSSSGLAANEIGSMTQSCSSIIVEKEQQLFSPSTKQVIEEIAVTAAVDKETMLSCTSAKRGIIFPEISGEQTTVLDSEKLPSSSQDAAATDADAGSPVKKLKNKNNQIQAEQ